MFSIQFRTGGHQMNSSEPDFKISIPEPCHEDWNEMSPRDKGRFCTVCDKVVVDFTGYSIPEIGEHFSKLEGKICGRFQQYQLREPELKGTAYYRYPLQRIRMFLMAFVAVFGLEFFGLGGHEVQATVIGHEGTSTLIEEGFEVGDSIRVRGKVLSVIDNDPVMYVTVLARKGDEVISATMTDAEGNFELAVPTAKILSGSYDLVLRYLGRERVEKDVAKDVKEMAFLIDNSYALQSVMLVGMNEHTGFLGGGIREYLGGGVASTGITSRTLVGITMSSFEQVNYFYRPLEDWLMMHNSEVNQSGRW